MAFLRQVKFEIRNILRSRFLLIIAILTVLISMLVPALDYFGQRRYQNNGSDGPIVYASERLGMTAATVIYPGGKDIYQDYGSRGEPITIDGKTINNNHPFYWNVENMLMEKRMFSDNQGQFSSPAVLDLTIQLIDSELNYIMAFTPYITGHGDYRMSMVFNTLNVVHQKFYLENSDQELKVLEEIANHRKTSVDPTLIKANFKDLSPTDRQAALDKAQEQLEQAQKIVVNNDFPLYIDLEIKLQQDQIKGLEENIAIQEAAIIANPEQEENLNQIIKDLKHQIENIKTNRIPILEYRLQKMIIPGTDSWQNNALNDLENNRNQLQYYIDALKLTEEEWNEQQRGGGGVKPLPGYYGYPEQNRETYKDYIAGVQKNLDATNLTIAVAQQSLDTERPDMRYVRNGARSKTNSFLWYSTVVMMFGIMLGGWLIASEHQQGTIRLLMIRPKTRTKILLAKFTGALAVWIAVDLIASFANMLFNGIFFGFGDFAFPNYTIGGEISFLAYYLPRLAACALPILFLFTLSFLLSVVVKNTAVSVGLPIVAYVVGFIFLGMFSYRASPAWLQYTPVPYLQMPSLVGGTDIMGLARNLSLTTGILLLLGYSLVNVIISIVVFKKRDIVN